ncbi:hypothetical protein K2173_004223 [Erythroxylum novogranatense]|uniref:Uncharacterized protein n=1 Tax=Erythroxylum novogranatense TaxID=1862640 RepID=A0AAV8U835_9ROSI|nr:hypothetical protein K2173_004223 [Erythroxylum novogranatense]
MSNKTLDSRHSIDSCILHLNTWRPFHIQSLDSDPQKPHRTTATSTSTTLLHSHSLTKRPCLSNRTTSFSIDFIDMSKLSLLDDDKPPTTYKRPSFRLLDRKRRRRRGSRSVSGRSSVGASAAPGTCSDFPVAMGTDSSGELFGNGDANWASDVSEAKNYREREERDYMVGCGQFGNFDPQGNESGYGSEPGYRGDAEFGYGDEVEEEEDDSRLLFWGNHYGGADTDSNVDGVSVGENSFSDKKAHHIHRSRRKKHDCRMVE